MKKVRSLLLIVCIMVFVYSAYQLISYYYATYINKKTYDAIKDNYISEEAIIDEADDGEDIEKMLQDSREENFRRLHEINKDIMAWLYVPGTEVDYPVVQGEDNSFYLTHDVEGKSNIAGSIFLDYRNSLSDDFLVEDRNTIIYGHQMKNGSMFTSLKRYKQQSFLKENPFIYLDTLSGRQKYEIFSVFITEADYDYITIDFQQDDKYLSYLERIKDKSMYSTDIEFSPRDKIITLSTCSYEFDDARLAVVGRLVE